MEKLTEEQKKSLEVIYKKIMKKYKDALIKLQNA